MLASRWLAVLAASSLVRTVSDVCFWVVGRVVLGSVGCFIGDCAGCFLVDCFVLFVAGCAVGCSCR